ncbi:hypothetical protein chiPu_0020821 [Chiloscyllium punctatum]|uniref:Uncharacterized protein n=1 Tax=Chiloscyllium punctatum TaxID=137246 RepID=A0A401RK26_CHIPU|nr:hypothetical protein [Chiloscyllium punctatum]
MPRSMLKSTLPFIQMIFLNCEREFVRMTSLKTEPAEFEPAERSPNGFLIHHLHHAAMTTPAQRCLSMSYVIESSILKSQDLAFPGTPVFAVTLSCFRKDEDTGLPGKAKY